MIKKNILKEIMTSTRLKYEFANLSKIPNVVTQPEIIDLNSPIWKVTLKGPKGTPYEDGNFKLQININSDHPFKPPRIIFITKIYHPNISENGHICIDILKDAWSPALTISKVLLSISSLLNEPNPNDPLIQEIADLFINNKKKFKETAELWTKQYAIENK